MKNQINEMRAPFTNLLQIFMRTFDDDNVAAYVKCGDVVKAVTYEKMKQHLAHNIHRNIQNEWTGKKIALIGMFGYGWILNFFTILAKGGVAVLIDGNLSDSKINELIHLGGAEYTATSDSVSYQSVLPGILFSNDPDDYDSDLSNPVGFDVDLQKLDPMKPAVIAFTSGTTGIEKAVVLSHQSICSDVYGCRKILKRILKPNVTVLPLLPYYHMFGLTAGVLLPMSFRMSVVFIDSLKYTTVALRMTNPDLLIAVPLILETLIGKISRLADSVEGAPGEIVREVFGDNLKYVVSGGALLRDDVYDYFSQFDIELLNGYGMTECSPIIAVNPAGSSKKGTVGLPLEKEAVQIRVEDGELLVRGNIVMQEYLDNQSGTREMFENEWMRTGDLGFIDDQGYIHITGRKKDLIILPDGNNVSPEELENLLIPLPEISSVMVSAEESSRNSFLVAHIYPSEEYSTTDENLRAQIENYVRIINQSNPAYKRIQKIYFVDQDFEKNSLGKIKRYKTVF